MTKEEAVKKLQNLKTLSIGVDKLLAISSELHHCIGVMTVYGVENDLMKDVYDDSPEEMTVKFEFNENEFSAVVIDSGLEPGHEPYDYLWEQTDDKTFLKMVDVLIKNAK